MLRSRAWSLLATILIAIPLAPAAAQVAITSGSSAAPAAISVISQVLEEGRTLETKGRWGDALAHYEDALRQHPGDPALSQRFDYARLRYSLERRIGDRSFRASVQALSAQNSLDLYNELLLKINTHYVDTPPWQQLAHRGLRSLEVALTEPEFVSQHGLQVTESQLQALREEFRRAMTQTPIRSQHEAVAFAADIARRTAQRVRLSQTAVLMEFAAAAADGLDNYSAFLTANQLRDVYSQIEGNFVGLGVELKADNGALLILHVIPGSPAERSGILSGDRIVAVDGQPTNKLSTEEAAALLTGEEGSVVQVTIERPQAAPLTVSVRREHVEVPSLEDVQIIDPAAGVAYLRIPSFQKSTAADVDAALWQLHRQGMRSLIIDLRGNPGGLLTASVELADKFVASGPLVSTRGRSQAEDFDYQAHRAGTWRVPLVVLIDGDSASASEIFAAAIKDSGRGKIIGSRSYGKGSVQGIFPLGYGGAGIRLTTAKFYSPHGRPISMIGVSPDIGTRPATLATEGESSSNPAQLVGYRGTSGDPEMQDATARTTQKPVGDPAIATAIEVVRNEPVPVL